MANPFVKAAAMTVAVVALALLLVSQIDASREQGLKSSIDSVTLETDTARLIGRYEQVLGQQDACTNLNITSQLQKDRAYSLAFQIQDYQRANILGEEYNGLRREYFVSLMDLYISSYENKKNCPAFSEIPVVYYYREGDCPDCAAQNSVLEQAAARCTGIRIYAFPVNSEFKFLDLLKNRNNVTSTPAIVVNDNQTLTGLNGEDSVIAAIRANGAQCS